MTEMDRHRAPQDRPAEADGRGAYRDAWRHTPGRIAYAVLAFPLGLASFTALVTGFSVSAGLLILVVGIWLLALTLWITRGLAVGNLELLRLTGLAPIPEPEWDTSPQGPARTWWGRLLTPLRNPRYWVAAIHQGVVQPVIALGVFIATAVWTSVALGGVTAPLWLWAVDRTRPEEEYGKVFGGWRIDGLNPDHAWMVEAGLEFVAGALALLTLPLVMALCAQLSYQPARLMLGRWASDDAAVALRAEARARDAALRAEAQSLRRLERDLHDGPQQRLVRLQMDLSSIERRLAHGDSGAAAELAREARGQSQAALDELRALSSGVAPPLLTDRGLYAALTALAAGSPVPVTAHLDPAVDTAGPEVARAIYFVAAELLTNVAKHAGASSAGLSAVVDEDGGVGRLRLVVTDDGRGGALPEAGRGLAGLNQRVQGLRGEMRVSSPAGGPTEIVVTAPLGEPTLGR